MASLSQTSVLNFSVYKEEKQKDDATSALDCNNPKIFLHYVRAAKN